MKFRTMILTCIPWSEYASRAIGREKPNDKSLTVVDEACTGCVQVNYVVTNLCRGCVASPCVTNCPKNAIRYTSSGQTEINAAQCVNCGLCQQACPYHAIIYMPIPCEEACPVGAIRKNEHGVEEINTDKCVYCGKCIMACPFGAIFELSSIIDVLCAIEKKQQVIAMVAPAIYRSIPKRRKKYLLPSNRSDSVKLSKLPGVQRKPPAMKRKNSRKSWNRTFRS